MTKFLRLMAGLLLLIGAVAAVNHEKINRLMAVNSLFSEEKITHNFSHMNELFETAELDRGTELASPLPLGEPMNLSDALREWVDARSVNALVILKDGELIHESYFNGTGSDDPRISWSVAKSFLSALTGVLLADGTIESLDVPVTQYAPALIGSAYDGASLRNVLNMASGVEFDEDYLKFSSDINKMGRVLALGGSMDKFAAGLTERFTEPGQQWQYVSTDTHVIGMVIRGATGRDIPTLLSKKIVQPLGLEATPFYVTDNNGVAFVLGGLNLTTRDYARFGQMIAQNGMWQGQQIVPADWVAQSTAPSAPNTPEDLQYGFQWWIPADARSGEFFARGIYGQYIYIDQQSGTVIAVNSADRQFREPDAHPQNLAAFRAISRAED